MCGTSVELSEEQERKIHSMLQVSDAGVVAGEQQPAQPARPMMSAEGGSLPVAPTTNPDPLPVPVPRRTPERRLPLPSPRPIASERSVPAPARATRRSLRDWLQHMPAWLMSMLFHMALLALLALLMLEVEQEDHYITLSTEANHWSQSGGEVRLQNPDNEFHFDLPLPAENQPKTPRERRDIVRADQDARQLRIDPTTDVPQLPPLQHVRQALRSEANQRALAARDPRVRVEMVKHEGGTTLTEAAVARGLRWMSLHQNRDGSWSLNHFHDAPLCNGQCRGQGSIRSDSAATSLCLLPFLGAGQTHQTGIYRDTVSQGLRWLLQHQKPNGDLRADSQGNAGMYAHGQGAIVLCEAYALTRDEILRAAAQRSIDFIVEAQHIKGGWRYRPDQEGDTSVFGWMLMALQSARVAELNVPPESIDLASMYLDSVQYDDGSRYAYQPNHRPTHVMTAEALLCRMYMGWKQDVPGIQLGIKYLSQEHMPRRAETNYYYWYYATQVMHHCGGRTWNRWNTRMRDILVQSQLQEARGHAAGSWEPRGGHASQGGRLYATSLAVCTLEVYYRHAPIFRPIDLE
jgi:hypothetical protein